MADIANPTGHVATYNDLLTTIATDGDVYITDDTQEAYQFSGSTVSWAMIGSATSTEPTPPAPEPAPTTEPPAPEPLGGTVGTAVAGTTTLDTLVSTAYSTKSADLAGAISYVWYTPFRIVGTFPAATSSSGKNASCVRIYIEAQVHAPSSLTA